MKGTIRNSKVRGNFGHLFFATLLISLCVGMLFPEPAVSQNVWEKVGPPIGRNRHAMAYDSARGVAVLFGGWDHLNRNDTWEWDGEGWSEISPVASPSARLRHAMAYDSARDRVVLFGGDDEKPGLLRDTWLYTPYGPECLYGPPGQPLAFTRGSGAPVKKTVEWESCDGPGTLTVYNGGLENSIYELVSSSEIYLNGLLVVGPNNFNQKVETITVEIYLEPGNNFLDVELRGKPGDGIKLEFTPDE